MASDAPGVRVVDANGCLVLSSVVGAAVAGGVPYAAFGFSTAAEPELAPPSFDSPPPVPVPPDSARHVATRLRSTSTTDAGVVSEYETDDPTRTLTVTVAQKANAPLEVDVGVNPPSGVTSIYASFASAADEAFHGFGGRRESTNLRGQAFTNWVFDYRYPDVSTAYYDPQPMFLSSSGYALWVDTDAVARFRMASDTSAWRVSVGDSHLRLLVAPGGGAAPLATITKLSGRHRVAPSWSMGPTLSRTVQLYVDTPDVYLKKVQDDLKHIAADNLGIEAYAYEGWSQLPPDTVRQINATLTAEGVHPMLYLRSFVSNDGAFTEPTGRYAEATAMGYVAKTTTGDVYNFLSPFNGLPAAVVDFTNPDARTWWKGLVTAMLDLGADGFMNDFGEQVVPGMVFADGSTGTALHNRFPVMQNQVTREAVDAYMAGHAGRDIFFFARAGYAGNPGSAAYENAQFPGDETCDWNPVTGLPSIVPDMLNRAIVGAFGFTTDIGGYADFKSGLDEELYTRWTEAAVFTTHFRVHNSALRGVKMPWAFGATTEATWRAMAALHVRARPLIAGLWNDAQTSGVPPVRPVWLEHPAGVNAAHDDDEWMIGPDLLVAPVLKKGASSREVWFPPGCWQWQDGGASFDGNTTATVSAPIDTLPWFVRCGQKPIH